MLFCLMLAFHVRCERTDDTAICQFIVKLAAG